jgi:hypothetical protein
MRSLARAWTATRTWCQGSGDVHPDGKARAWLQLVRAETSRDIVMWSFTINQFIEFISPPPDATLIMAPRGSAKGKQAEKLAETPEAKTIWYLLVDHEGQLSFGELTDLDVQADITVAALKRMIKDENPTELGPFKTNKIEVWTYKHKDLSSDPTFEELEEILGPIKFLKASKNPKRLSPKQKVKKIDLPEDVILLVRVPPPQTTDTATAGDKDSKYSYVLLQLSMSDNGPARNWRWCSLIGAFPRVPSHIHQRGKLGRLPGI